MDKNYTIYKLEILRAMGFKFVSFGEIISHKIDDFNSLKLLNTQIKSCNLCQLCKSRTNSVIGSGNISSGVVFVLDSPNVRSDENGLCTPDDSLLRYLNLAGLNANEIYFTYILKCINKQNNWHYNDICTKFFDQELAIIKPKFIVSFGLNCFKELAKNSSFESHRGGIYRLKNSLYMPTFDNAWIDKNPSKANEFIADLKKIKGYL